MPKAADDFAKKTAAQKTLGREAAARNTFGREAAALGAVLDALATLDAASQAFVWQTAGERLGLTPAAAKTAPRAARKRVDKTHWYSETQPFGPRNLDC